LSDTQLWLIWHIIPIPSSEKKTLIECFSLCRTRSAPRSCWSLGCQSSCERSHGLWPGERNRRRTQVNTPVQRYKTHTWEDTDTCELTLDKDLSPA
jgi:hypothetical protein